MFRRTHHGRFYNDIHAFVTGSGDITQLPLEDPNCWREVFEYPVEVEGRRNPAVTMGIERLLHEGLEETAMEVRRSTAIQVLEGGEPPARRQAMRCLAAEGPTPDVLAVARGWAFDPDIGVGEPAVNLLVEGRPDDSVDLFLSMLRRTDDVRATMAGDAICQIGEEALPGLVEMLDDRDAAIRWRATRCLTRMAQEGKQYTLEPLIEAFHDDSPNVAQVAADGLVALGSRAAIPTLRSVLRAPLTESTIKALHSFSLHAAPSAVFQPVARATIGSAVSSSTLTAVDKALENLETQV